MNQIHTFTCGHQAEEPRFMGRGQARQRRLTAYFNRKCATCSEQAILALYASLTSPASQETINKRVDRLRRSY